ncbi:hypothetical protein ACVV4F_22795 [Escherichia coli]
MKMFLRMLLISTGVGDENNAPPSRHNNREKRKNNRECDRQEINGGLRWLSRTGMSGDCCETMLPHAHVIKEGGLS